MKRYQNALKLHSQGPEFFAEAEEAYRDLFESEIFTYPESLSEPKWIELSGDVDAEDDVEDDSAPENSGPVIGADGTPSTLPQILYLAYKNHGQFRLDRLKHRLLHIERDLLSQPAPLVREEIYAAASSGLLQLIEALSRDETDLELWRSISRVSEFSGSRRVARYCLEAVISTGDLGIVDKVDALGLEERFAAEQLRLLLPKIQDSLSEAQFLARPYLQKSLSTALQKLVDPYPYLPKASPKPLAAVHDYVAKRVEVNVPARSWTAVGKALLLRIQQEAQGIVDSDPGAEYTICLPSKPTQPLPNRSLTDPRWPSRVTAARYGAATSTTSTNLNDNSSEKDLVGQMMNSPIEETTQSREQIEANPTSDSPKTSNEGADSHQASDAHDVLATVDQKELPTEPSIELPTRKRSSDTAELPESNDALRSRSKRIKARGSLTDATSNREETAEDWAKWFEQQLKVYVQADQSAFQSVNDILIRLGCSPTCPSAYLEKVMYDRPTSDQPQESTAIKDNATGARALKQLLHNWDLTKSKAFLNGGGLQDPAKGSQGFGLSTFLEQSMRENSSSLRRALLPEDHDIDVFTQRAKEMHVEGINPLATQWLVHLLLGEASSLAEKGTTNMYEDFLWPDQLKATVVQMLVQQDEVIYRTMDEALELDLNKEIQTGPSLSREEVARFIQAAFELHLDIYSRITNPSSTVDLNTRTLQRDRLHRWASLASKNMNLASWLDALIAADEAHGSSACFRFLWSTVVCNYLLDPSSSEHTVACYRDLMELMKRETSSQGVDCITISLINNALIPEISIIAAEREISRLTTMDFFTSIFSSHNEDPYVVVESLEPLLEMSTCSEVSANKNLNITPPQAIFTAGDFNESGANPVLFEALQFLNRASLSLHLFLWQKLRDAYSVINYPSRILACNLRSFALIVQHLDSTFYVNSTREQDSESYLHWLHKVDDLMSQILALVFTDSTAFDCIDDDHIRSLMETLGTLLRILHVFELWEDSIRVGQCQPPIQVSSTASKAQIRSAEKFRDMIVKTWTLQYMIFREAMVQNQSIFTTPSTYLLNYLKSAHHALGLRTYCGLANRIFLRLAKAEMLRMKPKAGWDTDMPQIIFDFYGLKISSTLSEVQEHACEPIEIDKATALEILDLVMLHVNRMSIKDLLKSDLKFAVDKLQQVIKVPKLSSNTAARQFNKRLINNYLKSPINPVELFRSLRGIGGLCGTEARTEGWEVAHRGWYFLLGHISLVKFKSQKRVSVGSTDDLEHAKVFFKHDLEFDTERWETWYRLAQTYDTILEDYTTWTADKLDNDMIGIVELQRQAILCYTMAVAIAARCANASFEDTSKIASLYSDFGARVYASTRDPFAMRVFSLHEYEKHYNGATRGMYMKQPFRALQLYPAWKFASALLRQASLQKPNDWIISYMLGKVLWKMHNGSAEVLGNVKRISYEFVIDAFIRAIECVPDKRDSRHPEKDPILEPHYKLLSVVHKLVQAKRCSSEQGCHILKATHYARRVPDVQESEEWVDYMQEVLKALRSADKANWHHRMVARAAHTIYETDPDDLRTWLGAKHELTQQIFTKTMTIQVWKPDNERAGRHFVYTGRYVSFFVQILFKLKDKDSLEVLARRIRKRGGDFFNHADIWQELSFAYLTVKPFSP